MRASTFIAGAVLAAGAAVALPAAAFAATDQGAHANPCVKTHGKYQGTLVKKFWINGGDDTGTHVRHAGIGQAWHSAKCQTVWTVTTKVKKPYTTKVLFTSASVGFGDHIAAAHAKTKGSVTSPVVKIGKHRKVDFSGGWLGPKYTFDGGTTIKF